MRDPHLQNESQMPLIERNQKVQTFAAQRPAEALAPNMRLKDRHHPPRGIVGSSWFNFLLLKQRHLLPQKEILGCQGAAEIGP
jgi:hypothetical protein